MLFQTIFEKNPVAKASEELVCFFCRSARFAVLQLLFSGSAEVAAGLSNGFISMDSGGFPAFSRDPDGFPGRLRGYLVL